ALERAFDDLAEDRSVRVAVLTGSGRAFAAGMDVRVLRGLDVAAARSLITSLEKAIDAVHQAPFPVVAAINGPALGAGFERVLARILAGAPGAIRLTQELMVRWRTTDLATAVHYGINAFATAYATGEPGEGAAAFLEKRSPRWSVRVRDAAGAPPAPAAPR